MRVCSEHVKERRTAAKEINGCWSKEQWLDRDREKQWPLSECCKEISMENSETTTRHRDLVKCIVWPIDKCISKWETRTRIFDCHISRAMVYSFIFVWMFIIYSMFLGLVAQSFLFPFRAASHSYAPVRMTNINYTRKRHQNKKKRQHNQTHFTCAHTFISSVCTTQENK